MTTFVYRNGKLVEKSKAKPLFKTGPSAYVISDTMDHTWHPASGKFFDSKKRFRDETRAHGCVEIGNPPKDFGKRSFIPKLDKRQRREDIQRTVYELRNGRKPI